MGSVSEGLESGGTVEYESGFEGATNEWYKRRDGRPDTPRVSVWFPRSLPSVNLDTYYDGEREYLPDRGPITAHIIVGGVDIGGPLDDLELLWKAVQEQLIEARAAAARLGREDVA